MSCEMEFTSRSERDDDANDVVDIMSLLPVEPYGCYEEESIYMVDGVPLDGSDIDYGAEDEPEWYGGTTIENLIPVEEPRPEPYAPSVFDEEEEERRIKREQVNDAYALAAAAWTDEEADEILRANLPSLGGFIGDLL